VIFARQLLDWAVAASALINEVVESYDDHFSLELNRVKLHPGQMEITTKLQKILSDSKLTRKRAEDLFSGTNGETVFTKKIQEYYSLRCITQILGPITDTIHAAEKVVLNEINSVNDNPVIDFRNGNVFHGGNFHGDYISLEMDKLKLSITKLSMLAERQLNFLMNDKLNGKLPPFVNLGVLGLNLGMQGTQFTATSTVAENQVLSNPVYVHSIPTNNDNQDLVSMGTNAALMACQIIENSYEVMSVHLLTLLQAVDFLQIEDKMSTFTKELYHQLRAEVPVFTEDHFMAPDIRKINEYISHNSLNI
jgi:histidine ammonia-lyase